MDGRRLWESTPVVLYRAVRHPTDRCKRCPRRFPRHPRLGVQDWSWSHFSIIGVCLCRRLSRSWMGIPLFCGLATVTHPITSKGHCQSLLDRTLLYQVGSVRVSLRHGTSRKLTWTLLLPLPCLALVWCTEKTHSYRPPTQSCSCAFFVSIGSFVWCC